MPHPIGVPLEPSLYLQPFMRHSASKTRAHARTQTHAASDFIFCPMQCIALDRRKANLHENWNMQTLF